MSSERDSLLSSGDESVTATVAADVPKGEDLRNLDNDVLPETATVGRRLGWTSAYMLVISRVIGSGIFAMPGTIIQGVGSGGLALVLWVLGALFAWAGLAIGIEYGCMLPRSGGLKVYLEYTFRKPRYLASTIVAVHAVLLGFTAANCIVFAKYVLFALDYAQNDFNIKLLAAALLTVLSIIHGCFYRTGVFVQNLLGWVKVALVVFMIVTGIVVVLFGGPLSARPTDSLKWNKLWKDTDWNWNNISTAFFKVFYSYAGLENVNNIMNEVQDPVRTLKSVCTSALVTSCLLYLLVNVAYLAVVPLSEIKASRELIAALFFERVFGTGWSSVVLPLAIALSAAGNVMVVMFSLARLKQEIARQGFLPYAEILASSKPFNAPLGGVLVHYIPSLLVIVCPPSSTVYAFIADIEVYTGQFFSVAVSAGLIILRYRQPDLLRPYRAWLPAVWVRTVFCVALIFAPAFVPKKGTGDVNFFYATYALVGLAVIIFSILYWWVWTIAIPRYYGYSLEEESDVLSDGTTVVRLVKRKPQPLHRPASQGSSGAR